MIQPSTSRHRQISITLDCNRHHNSSQIKKLQSLLIRIRILKEVEWLSHQNQIQIRSKGLFLVLGQLSLLEFQALHNHFNFLSIVQSVDAEWYSNKLCNHPATKIAGWHKKSRKCWSQK